MKLSAKLEEAAGAPWASELAPLHIDGCMLDETVFVHRGSRTVVAPDLTEDFATSPHWPTRLYLKLAASTARSGEAVSCASPIAIARRRGGASTRCSRSTSTAWSSRTATSSRGTARQSVESTFTFLV